jgi:protein involved in polysaccharide export with SLBB domain
VQPGAGPEIVKPANNALSPRSEDALSSFESYVQEGTAAEPSDSVRQLGYDLFNSAPAAFAPVETVPVGPDYMLGPGDELKVSIWGKLNAEHIVQIDRDGAVTLPLIGVMHISGLTFSEAKDALVEELGRYYMRSEVKMNLSMGRLRSIRVFVVGYAKRPGGYTLSSLSTLVNALISAGGPSKTGTMRDIQVRRAGAIAARLDMYEFLLKGDKSGDSRLMPEDVIYIPPAGPLVAMTGSVRNPAIYELKGRTTLKEIIETAGGISATGFLQRVQVERVFEHSARMILDVNLAEMEGIDDVEMMDGDAVRVFPISGLVSNQVVLKGNVLRPGTYEWKDGLGLRGIIKGYEDLLPDTYLKAAVIQRLVPPDYHREYLSVSLEALFAADAPDVELEPHDEVAVYGRWEMEDKYLVRAAGAVNRPGEYEYRPNMRLSDLLNLAGGPKRYAYLRQAEVTRVTPSESGPVTEKILVDLDLAIRRDLAHDIALREDDYLFVRTVPEWGLYRMVSVGGEVRFPGTHTIMKGETISSLIDRAGGFTGKAYLKGAVFTRESVRALQQRQLDEAVDRLEQELLSRSAGTIESALSPDDAKQEEAAFEQRRALIVKMRSARAKGRIALRLDEPDGFRGTASDLALEDGDSLMVPETPSQVQVIGSVFNQTAFVYSPGHGIPSYLRKAGGLTENANGDALYVLKVDGTAISRGTGQWGVRWDPGEFRWVAGGLMAARLDPGDTIVVPEKMEKTAWMREVKDLTQILYQIAVTAGVLIVAF